MSETITPDEYQQATKPHKYGAKRTVIDGIAFDSKKEARRYQELKLLERMGQIKNLALQPRFPIVVANVHICEYRGDFSYIDSYGDPVLEDCKGLKTPIYKLKKKLFEALYMRKVLET